MERLEHARLLYSPLSPQVCSNSCPESLCYLTVSSSPDIFCFQSFPTIGSFLMSLLALHIRWPEYWSFSFSISPSNEYSGLILFRIDWFISLLSKGLSRVDKLSYGPWVCDPLGSPNRDVQQANGCAFPKHSQEVWAMGQTWEVRVEVADISWDYPRRIHRSVASAPISCDLGSLFSSL